jgi:hypothetical protein
MANTLHNLIACATCVPNSDAKIAMAGNSAILVMLILLAFVLGSICSFIVYLMRRASRADSALAEQGIDTIFPPTSE